MVQGPLRSVTPVNRFNSLEIDSISESSSQPVTPANTLSRPQSHTSGVSAFTSRTRPSSNTVHRKRSLIDDTLTERSKEQSVDDTSSVTSELKSNKMSRYSPSSSLTSIKRESVSSRPGSDKYDKELDNKEQDENDFEEMKEDIAAADEEIQGIESKFGDEGTSELVVDEARGSQTMLGTIAVVTVCRFRCAVCVMMGFIFFFLLHRCFVCVYRCL